MEKKQYAVGDRVEKMCLVCAEERGHIVAIVTKLGRVSRVSCPQCNTRSTFKDKKLTAGVQPDTRESAPYSWTKTYRKGQRIQHQTFGIGEVTVVIEPDKIDVLFSDRVRRLVHAHPKA